MRDWLQSELDGRSDGGEEVYAYLQRHGITREEAVTRRKRREDLGVEIQHLVLAFFANEDAADQAAIALKRWEKATEYMRGDGIGVRSRTRTASRNTSWDSAPGRRAGHWGRLGVVAAIPAGGLSLAGGALGGPHH